MAQKVSDLPSGKDGVKILEGNPERIGQQPFLQLLGRMQAARATLNTSKSKYDNIRKEMKGDGVNLKVLDFVDSGRSVLGIDIESHAAVDLVENFFLWSNPLRIPVDIVTNPPFSIADEFIEHALNIVRPHGGKVVMLLPFEFSAAIGRMRKGLFTPAQNFKVKIELVRRISWTNLEVKYDTNGKPVQPMKKHALYVWDFGYEGQPLLQHAPIEHAEDLPLYRGGYL